MGHIGPAFLIIFAIISHGVVYEIGRHHAKIDYRQVKEAEEVCGEGQWWHIQLRKITCKRGDEYEVTRGRGS